MAIPTLPTQVLTGKVRFSFLHVFEPAETLNKGVFKYSVQLLIRKTDTKTVEAFKNAYKAAYDKGVESVFGSGKALAFGFPLRDGDAEYEADIAAGKDTYKGMYFVNASCLDKYPPTVVDPVGMPLMSRTDLFSGCWGRALVNMYPYAVTDPNTKKVTSKGVACGLSGIQLLEQGDSLGGGGGNVAAMFATIDEDDEI